MLSWPISRRVDVFFEVKFFLFSKINLIIEKVREEMLLRNGKFLNNLGIS